MNFELSIIKAMLKHETWLQHSDKLSITDLPRDIQPLYSIVDNYHQTHTDDLTVADYANLVLAHQHKDPDFYKGILQQLENMSVSDTTTQVLIKSFYKQRLLKEISLSAYDLTEGRGSEEDFQKLLSKLEPEETPDTEEFEFVTDDIEALLETTYRQTGLRWRLNTLNKMFGSLRPGDFGFIFARPETGKTTFLASETTYMASQLSADAGPVIWFNNEEADDKVRIRCFQASLGATLAQINANPTEARRVFQKNTHGKHLLLKSGGSISKKMVEGVIKKYKPSLVVYDQIDKITGFDADRDDLKLGKIYQWGRELAKQYSHATIAVCQADGTGEGQKWLTMANVANAKTAKQAEADWILGIGKTSAVGYESVRYLHASKNKLGGDSDTDEALRHGKVEVLIRAAVARYEDLQ